MCVVAVLVAVPGFVELFGTDFKKNPSKSVTRDQPTGIEASVPVQPTITPAGAAALACSIFGGDEGLFKTCGQPEKIQLMTKIKINKDCAIRGILVFHSLVLDIVYGFGIIATFT